MASKKPLIFDTVTTLKVVEIDPNSDGVSVRHVQFQNDTSNDSTVEISRDSSDNMTFKDGANTVKTLSDLVSQSIKYYIEAAESLVVEQYHQYNIFNQFIVDGTVTVDGQLNIFS